MRIRVLDADPNRNSNAVLDVNSTLAHPDPICPPLPAAEPTQVASRRRFRLIARVAACPDVLNCTVLSNLADAAYENCDCSREGCGSPSCTLPREDARPVATIVLQGERTGRRAAAAGALRPEDLHGSPLRAESSAHPAGPRPGQAHRPHRRRRRVEKGAAPVMTRRPLTAKTLTPGASLAWALLGADHRMTLSSVDVVFLWPWGPPWDAANSTHKGGPPHKLGKWRGSENPANFSYLPVRLVTAIRKAVRVSSAARLALCLRRWVWVVQEAIPTE